MNRMLVLATAILIACAGCSEIETPLPAMTKAQSASYSKCQEEHASSRADEIFRGVPVDTISLGLSGRLYKQKVDNTCINYAMSGASSEPAAQK